MRALILATFLVFSGSSWANSESENTVSDNRSISKAVTEKLQPILAEAILNTPYDGFYQISGKQRRGDEFRFTRVKSKKSFPDDRWEQLAVDVASRINFKSGSNNIGSKTKASATAYVVLFKEGIEGVKRPGEGESLALIMIDQRNMADPQNPTRKISGKKLYMLSVAM